MGRVCAELRIDSPKLGGEKRNPQPTCRSNRVEWFKTSTGGRRVGWIRDDEKIVEKTQIRRKSHRIQWDFARSGQNLIEFKGNSTGIWKNITGIWVFSPISGKFWPESGNLWVGSSFSGFKGGKPKPNLPESVFGDEFPPPTRWSSWVGQFRVGSGWFFGWVRYSDESGQP